MIEHRRVIVVGGGVSGASCLYHLAERDVSDCLLIEQNGLASGSSGRSAAFIETQYLDEDRIRLCSWSLDLYEHFVRDHGLRFAPIGKLLLGYSDEMVQAFERSVAFQRTIGRSDSQVLDPEEVRAAGRPLRLDGLAGALWGPSDGYTDAAQLCQVYLSLAQARGCETLVATRVEAIRRERDGRFALDTDRGSFTCEILINSCGAWAAQLGALLGVTIPVAGHRRQVGLYELAVPARGLPIVVVPSTGDGSPTLYFRQDGERRALAGLHSEAPGEGAAESPEHYRREADESFKEEVGAALSATLDANCDVRAVGGWAGLYPLTPDGEPILGEVAEMPGFYNAVGLGGNGVQLSAAIGRIIGELIVDGKSTLVPSLDRYRLERFKADG